MTHDLPYSVVDVFAERALEGNPLAVFHEGSTLTDAQMLAIARETNLSETTFVLRRDAATESRHGVRVRIFTTQGELPFAGHPTLGTASWLYWNDPALQAAARAGAPILLDLPVGPIPVRFTPEPASMPGIVATMTQNPPIFGDSYDPAEIAAVLGMATEDLLPGYRPQAVSTGNPFCIVALRSVQALERLAIPQREATAWLRARSVRWFYCVAPVDDLTGAGCTRWRARMQWYAGEDPATGSAAGPCIAYLVRHSLAPAGAEVVLQQGVEIHRPSRIVTVASIGPDGSLQIEVSGRTIAVAEGRLFLPA